MPETPTVTLEGERLTIKYEGSFDGLRLDTLVDSQRAFLALVESVAQQVVPGIGLEIRIAETRNGSFEIDTVLATAAATLMQTPPEAISTIFSVIKDSFALVKLAAGNAIHLKEKNPEGTYVEMVNDNGSTANIGVQSLNILGGNNNIVVNVNRVAKVLNADHEIESFSAELPNNQNVSPLNIPRDDFSKLSRRPRLPETPEYSETKDAVLYLRKVDVFPEDHTKWDFFYEDRSITNVKIEDSDFLERVRTEVLRFGAGDKIRCLMRVFYRHEAGIPYPVIKGYQVEDVYEFIPATKQTGFDFTEE